MLRVRTVQQGPTKREVVREFIVTSGLITLECGHCTYMAYAFERRFVEIAMYAHQTTCPALGFGPRPFQLRLNFHTRAATDVG